MSVGVTRCDGVAFRAFDGMEGFLLEELKDRFFCTDTPQNYGSLFYFPDQALVEPAWAQTVLTEGLVVSFDSIGEAARELRGIQRNWVLCAHSLFRRAALIQEKLPYINTKPRIFPCEIPAGKTGLWTLLDPHTLLAFANSSSPFPGGALELAEDHENPPSRAYLKLQEALLRFSRRFGFLPRPGERCYDAGACPGGWTWVLANLGCSVFAVDRAELAPSLMNNPLVSFTAHDAFTLPPQELGVFDWIFSDVICYPDRLLDWVRRWLETGSVRNMICTVKMQGAADWALINEFAAISGSFLQHLNYNKHEITWFYCAASRN